MRFHEEALRERYDAVVVGAGLGGLTAAALLARAGRRVLVVERHDRPGGYAHAFRRRGYRFDSAVHLVGGCEPSPFEEGALLHRLLRALGVRERCDFVPVDPCYRVEWPGLALDAPCGPERFVEAHVECFPAEEKGIRGFVEDCLAIRGEASRAEEHTGGGGPLARPARFPLLLRYRRATLGQVLEDRVVDPAARAALGALWPYLGLPPSQVSFLYYATMLMSYVADGAYYCRGTFQSLAEALVEAVRRQGGELVLRGLVRRVLVEDGRAAGVVLENGQTVRAPLVVSNADARQTVEELVGAEHFPARFRRRLRMATPSVSAFLVYAATSLDLDRADLAHETFLYEDPDHEAAHASGLRGEPRWLSMTTPSRLDPGLAPPGEHLLVLTTLVGARARAWRQAKPLLVDALLRRAERRLPGLRDTLRFVEGATPRTLERYTRNEAGALYGFDVTPSQLGPGRLDNETPLPGLYLAGHWTRPGGGVVGVVRSGLRTARLALGLDRDADLGI